MNIDRVTPRANGLGLGRTESPGRPFDLTISDQGVRANQVNQGRPAAREKAPTPLNSSEALGQLLSVEETRALREAFAPVAATVYTIRGQVARAAQGIAQGGLLDLTG
ncbi:MAG: hypothetical protein VX293_01010 [Candidatus Latescibacterota bacterium]|nr:hypothetical protein [Candidatus Latescibacterota bacterium]